jgi:transcriptional regulator with XRE-family HTH domain
MSTAFGKRFKLMRIQKELTQEELVLDFNKKYGYDYTASTISLYENNKRIPEIEALSKFADYFGVSIDFLLGKTDNKDIVILTKSEIPKELVDEGYEYIGVFKEAKEKGFSPKDIKDLIDFAQKMQKRP